MGYGMQSHASVQVQSALGTSLTTSLEFFSFLNESINVRREQMQEGGMRNRFVENPYAHGKYSVGGQITMEANPVAVGMFLSAAFGRTLTTCAAGGATHIFLPNVADHSARTAVRPVTLRMFRDATSAFLYWDLVPNQVTFNFPQGQFMSMAVDLIGGNYTAAAAGTFSLNNIVPFRWDQTSIAWTGGGVVDVEDMTIRINNNIEAEWLLVACSTPYRYLRTGPYKVDVEGTMTFVTSIWDVFMSGSQGALVVNAAGVSPHVLTFCMPNFRFYDVAPTVAGPGLVKARFSGGGMYDATSQTAIAITMVTCRQFF